MSRNELGGLVAVVAAVLALVVAAALVCFSDRPKPSAPSAPPFGERVGRMPNGYTLYKVEVETGTLYFYGSNAMVHVPKAK